MRKAIRLFSLLVAACLLSSCEVVDSQLLQKSREFFPKAEVYKVRPDTVQIETHIGNVSRKLVEEIFRNMLTQKGADIRQGFQVAGYRWLILGFDEYNAVWDLWYPQMFLVMDPQESGAWAMRTWGYIPDFKSMTVLR